MMKTTVCAAIAATLTTAAAFAGDVDAFSPAQVAEVRSAYFNATPAKDTNTERLTLARVDAIHSAFDAYLSYAPDVDSLSEIDVLRIKQQFDDALSTEENLVMIDTAPVLLAAN